MDNFKFLLFYLYLVSKKRKSENVFTPVFTC